MKNHLTQKLTALLFSAALFSGTVQAQTPFPNPALVGYWETWGNMSLTQINPNYNVIDIAFAVTTSTSFFQMEMADYSSIYSSKAAFLADIDALHQQGKVVILSIGGANDPVLLSSASEQATFVSTMDQIFIDHNDKFDGIDIDLENKSIKNIPNTWTMTSPAPQHQYLIDGIKQVMADYKSRTGRDMYLTFAPETYYVQGGLSSGTPGNGQAGYLPILEALKDDITMLHCQLYNVGGGNIALDGQQYNEGTGDFIVSMTEAVIKGFTLTNNRGNYSGLPASKVGFGLPSCAGTGSSGSVSASDICLASKYLRGVISKPSGWNYTTQGTYPDLRGMMTWDVNIDNASCGNSFATAFTCAFDPNTSVNNLSSENPFSYYPNPTTNLINVKLISGTSAPIKISDLMGHVVLEKNVTQPKNTIDVSGLNAGVYTLSIGNTVRKFIKE